MTSSPTHPGETPLPAAFDESDLASLGEAIGQVLSGQADRHALHRHIDGKERLDRMLWDTAVELGWPAIGLPEEFGGLGFGPVGLDLLHRRLGSCVAPGSYLATLTAAQSICEVGDEQTRAEWLPRLASGECKLAVAARIDAAVAGSRAWIVGDGDCDAALVPVADGNWGLVPIDGAEVAVIWDRTRSLITLDPAGREPLAKLPGTATGEALSRHFSLAIAADSIGGARAILDITVDYMKQREQFGRPIASFQALKHRVADHMTDVVSGEEFLSLAVDAAARRDPDAGIWARLAKARCSESYVRIAEDCLQLHGGVGFTWEYDVHMYLSRARLNELLVAPNTGLKDEAAAALADAIRSGREPLALA